MMWHGVLHTLSTADLAATGELTQQTWPTAKQLDENGQVWVGVPLAVWFRIVPTGFAGTETVDIDLNTFWYDGSGRDKGDDFAQITNSNAAQTLTYPQNFAHTGYSIANQVVPMHMSPYWGLDWTIGGGATAAGSITIYAGITFNYA